MRQVKLEKKMNADAVAHLLESRPDYWDLVDAGIIKDGGPTSVAPSLAARSRTLDLDPTHGQVREAAEGAQAARGRLQTGPSLPAGVSAGW